MALQFNPYPILNPEEYRKPDYLGQANQALSSGLDALVQMSQQKKQRELDEYLAKREEALKLSGMSDYERQNYQDALIGIKDPRKEQNPGLMRRLFSRGRPEPNRIQLASSQKQGVVPGAQGQMRIPSPPNPYGPEASDLNLAQAYRDYGPKYAKQYQMAQDRGLKQQETRQDMEKTDLEIRKLQKELDKEKIAREGMSQTLGDMSRLYGRLSELGGITDVRKSVPENLFARTRASGIGQAVEGALGTETQSIRNQIKQKKPEILLAIKQAKGLGSKGLDSDAEREFYLTAATDEKMDIQANLQAIQVLDRAYGLGMGIKVPNLYGIEPGTVREGSDGTKYKYMLGDPSVQSNWMKMEDLR